MMPELHRKRFELYARLDIHKRKVTQSQERVTKWLKLVSRPYIAFSGGKDSTCVLALVREQADIPAVYIDAECCFPEVRQLIDATPNTIDFPAVEPFLDTLARFGMDSGAPLDKATMRSTVYEPIKQMIEQYGFDGVAYGLRADECRNRAMHAYKRGAIFQYKRDGLWGCQPIWDWSYNNVWAFIVSNSLPYSGTYDLMWDAPIEDQRVSYWAGETKRRYGRWAWLKRNYPDLFAQLCKRIPEAAGYV